MLKQGTWAPGCLALDYQKQGEIGAKERTVLSVWGWRTCPVPTIDWD